MELEKELSDVFVTGHSVSAIGLTASLSKDSKAAGGDILIEAGMVY